MTMTQGIEIGRHGELDAGTPDDPGPTPTWNYYTNSTADTIYATLLGTLHTPNTYYCYACDSAADSLAKDVTDEWERYIERLKSLGW